MRKLKMKEKNMDPGKIQKILEISGAVISAAASLVTIIVTTRDERRV